MGQLKTPIAVSAGMMEWTVGLSLSASRPASSRPSGSAANRSRASGSEPKVRGKERLAIEAYRCPQCGAIKLSPSPSDERLRQTVNLLHADPVVCFARSLSMDRQGVARTSQRLDVLTATMADRVVPGGPRLCGGSRVHARRAGSWHVSLRAGAVRLLLTQDDGARGTDRAKGVGFSLQFTTAQDVDALAAAAKRAGAELDTEPTDAFGARVFRLRDPDGFRLVISSVRKA